MPNPNKTNYLLLKKFWSHVRRSTTELHSSLVQVTLIV